MVQPFKEVTNHMVENTNAVFNTQVKVSSDYIEQVKDEVEL